MRFNEFSITNMPRYWNIGKQRVSRRFSNGPCKIGHQIVVDVDKWCIMVELNLVWHTKKKW
ncbi:hypothetical protein ACJIZ3_023735 [Penstemon smallii]|uniref:Uncharacterized protein n=1 Tax=Penstemon smallii TaxID=265156 RepID=A0ABD3TPW7_9LAMI